MSVTLKKPRSEPRADRAQKRYRKFCVVVDGSAESEAAIRFAAGRAAHTIGGRVTLFYAIPPQTGGHWVAVREKMEEEARETAEEILTRTADVIFDYVGLRSEIVITEAEMRDGLLDFLSNDDAVFALILGALSGGAPGQLVDYFSGDIAGDLPCPVVIVPGALDPEKIDSIV